MQCGPGHVLYLQGSPGLFHDGTIVSGLGRPSLPHTGFGTGWIDGDLDLPVANGAVLVIEKKAAAGDDFPFGQPDQLFRFGDGGGCFGRTGVAAAADRLAAFEPAVRDQLAAARRAAEASSSGAAAEADPAARAAAWGDLGRAAG